MKLPKAFKKLADATALATLKSIVLERLSRMDIDAFTKALDSFDTDLWGRLSEEERRLVRDNAKRFRSYLGLLSSDLILQWLRREVERDPRAKLGFIYGFLRAHPKGAEFLDEVVEGFKARALGIEVKLLNPWPSPQQVKEGGEGGGR